MSTNPKFVILAGENRRNLFIDINGKYLHIYIVTGEPATKLISKWGDIEEVRSKRSRYFNFRYESPYYKEFG